MSETRPSQLDLLRHEARALAAALGDAYVRRADLDANITEIRASLESINRVAAFLEAQAKKADEQPLPPPLDG